MKLRQMTPDDYKKVYALWSHTPGMGLNDVDDSRAGIIKYLARNPKTCFVAEHDHGVIGVILSGHDGRRGYIYHMAVSPSARRKGIGTALLHKALEALKEEGIQKAGLVVFADNAEGNAFWEKQGFTKRKDLYYRNKAIAQ